MSVLNGDNCAQAQVPLEDRENVWPPGAEIIDYTVMGSENKIQMLFQNSMCS